jgi:tubulin--tyrosine ligase
LIQVVNDDGPPSTTSSPYVLDLVRALRANNHHVSVVLPDSQRSWISKAHIVGQTIKPTYYKPPPTPPAGSPLPANLDYVDTGTTHAKPAAGDSDEEEWLLVNSTPATCTQIGLFHHPGIKKYGKIDLVLSGPNFGRNTTAVFALSSGTLGGALEGAVCNVRSIALSYAFFNRNHDPVIVQGATSAAVKTVEGLVANWDQNEKKAGQKIQLFSVNVPLKEGVKDAKAVWTRMLLNTWSSGSCFTEIEEEEWGPEEEEEQIRRKESAAEQSEGGVKKVAEKESTHVRYQHRHFKWSPRFADVYKSVEDAPPGNDGWAVEKGYIRYVLYSFLENILRYQAFEVNFATFSVFRLT